MIPSEVRLDAIPLVGTMGHSELEIAAAYVVRTCRVLGDRWQPVTPNTIRDVLIGDIWENVEPFASLSRNPFAKPDFHALVRKGYADGVLVDGVLVPGSPIALNAKALEALARYRVEATR